MRKTVYIIFCLIFFLTMVFFSFLGCNSTTDDSSSENDDDNESDDDDTNTNIACDDDSAGYEDICDDLNPMPNADVFVFSPPDGNPLARKIKITTDTPCSLSGYAQTEGEFGYSPSSPAQSQNGLVHEFWFYGLLEDREFRYTFYLAGDPDKIVSSDCFDTPDISLLKPPMSEVIPDETTELNDWFMVYYHYSVDGQKPRYNFIFDRQGRYRFFHFGTPLRFTQVMDNGDLVSTTNNEIIGVRPNGDEYIAFDVTLSPAVLKETHHKFYLEDADADSATVIFAKMGPGVECDLVTPTNNAIGDGIAEINALGQETWRWDPFDHLDDIPPGAVDQDACLTYFWGANNTDWTHGNSVVPVPGENAYLMSLRNVSRVIKIDRGTGDVIWQMGEGLDFEWIGNEQEYDKWFHMQHDANWLDDGRFFVYDNSYFASSPGDTLWSRAMELEVDEDAMTVELLWEYRVPYHIFQGSIDLHENGNILVSTGSESSVIELPAGGGQGDELFTMHFPSGTTRAEYYPPLWVYEDPPTK